MTTVTEISDPSFGVRQRPGLGRLVWLLVIVVAAAAGSAVGRRPMDVILLIGGLCLLSVGLLRPRALLVGAIPAALLLHPATGDRLMFAIASILLIVLVVGAGRIWPRFGFDHLLLAALAGWLVLSYAVFSEPITPLEPPGRDLGTLLIGLSLTAVAISLRPSARAVTVVTVLTGTATAALVFAVGERSSDGRAVALGLNPNFVGVSLAVAAVAACALVRGSWALFWLAPVPLLGAAMLATGSREAFIATAIGVGFVATARRSRGWRIAFAVLLLLGALIAPQIGSSLNPLVGGDRGSAELAANNRIRQQVAQFALSVAIAHPVTGIGYGLISDEALRSPDVGIYINSHNDYLRLAAESGLPALVMFLLLAVRSLGRARDPDDVALLAIVLTFLACLPFANALSTLSVACPFWLALGVRLGNRSGAWSWRFMKQALSAPGASRTAH